MKTAISGVLKIAGVLLAGDLAARNGIARAEVASDKFANPVLAKADIVVGPLTEVGKLAVGAALDYSVLTASINVQDYTEIHRETRGTFPYPSVVTTYHRHYADPVDGKSIWESYVITIDSSDNASITPVSSETFSHGVGNANWKCVAKAPDGTLIAKSELQVKPTRMKARIDVAKFATYKIKYPSRVAVLLDTATTVLKDCDLGGAVGKWSFQTSMSPGTESILEFTGNNMIADYVPTIQIGYNRSAK